MHTQSFTVLGVSVGSASSCTSQLLAGARSVAHIHSLIQWEHQGGRSRLYVRGLWQWHWDKRSLYNGVCQFWGMRIVLADTEFSSSQPSF